MYSVIFFSCHTDFPVHSLFLQINLGFIILVVQKQFHKMFLVSRTFTKKNQIFCLKEVYKTIALFWGKKWYLVILCIFHYFEMKFADTFT